MDIQKLKEKLEEVHLSGYGWAVSCCRGDRAAAEDVLQTVYLKILEGKAIWNEKSLFKTWFFAVIRKTAIDHHRRNWFWDLFDFSQTEHIESSNLQNEIEYSEEQEFFRKILTKLPTRQREVLHLVFYQGFSLSEAAAVLNLSVGSARQHYERGKKKLRKLLEENGVYETGWKRKETESTV